MKILTVTLMHQIYMETVQSLFMQDWPEPLDYLFIAGDKDPSADSYQQISDKYERARHQALAGNYDAIFCVEADMVIPSDALRKLAGIDADVAYGLYCWRHVPAIGLWSAYPVVSERKGFSLSHFPAQAHELWGHVVRIAGVGLGCTLIRRSVLEAITFRHGEQSDTRPIPVHCDWILAEDCQALGFSQACDLSVRCGHIRPRALGGVIWPDIDAPDLYTIKPLGQGAEHGNNC
jgi:hypothetical protein